MILDIGHVALQVPDLDEGVHFATIVLGLVETERTGDRAFLALPSPYPSMGPVAAHHLLELRAGDVAALDHVGLVARDEASVERAVVQAARSGGTVLDAGPHPGIPALARVAAPAGHVFEIYTRMDEVRAVGAGRGVGLRRLGHVNLWARDVDALMDFWVDAFDFDVSDWIRPPGTTDAAGFARCHLEHHTLAAASAEVDGIYHYAFEAGSIADVQRVADALAEEGRGLLWGPARHGAGDNVAVYFRGPGGITVEVYADMQKISDPGWQPRTWTDAELPKALNAWGPGAGADARNSFKAALA